MLSFTTCPDTIGKSHKAGKTTLQALFFFLLITQICFAQWEWQNNENSNGVEQTWARHYGSDKVASSDRLSASTADSIGNIYITGISGNNIVTIKYNVDGDTIWMRRYGSSNTEQEWATAINVDRLGNVYITGGSNLYWGDFMTIKYSPDGYFLWVRSHNGPADAGDYGMGIIVDDELNSYVIGPRSIMEGQWQTQQPFMIKYDQNGSVIWQRVINSNSSISKNMCLAFDQDENVIVTEFSKTIKLNRFNGNTIWSNEDYPSYSWNQCIAVDKNGNVYINKAVEQPLYSLKYTTIKYYANGNVAWSKSHTGPGGDWDASSAITVDSPGNVYVTGSNNGEYITVKFNVNGDMLWQKKYNRPGEGGGRSCSIAVDAEGNVYVTGTDEDDFATLKYDSNGSLVWEKRFNGLGNGNDAAAALILDNNGFLLVTGSSLGESSDYDYTTIKYNTNGDSVWTKVYDGIAQSQDYAASLTVDESGNAYIIGRSNSTLTGEDFATVKFNTDGDLVWSNRYDGELRRRDNATSIGVDLEQNVYVTGRSEDSDTSSVFATIKYNSSGIELWKRQYQGLPGGFDGASLLKLGTDGNIYVTGTSDEDNATLCYNSEGDIVWASRYEFPGDKYEAKSLQIDKNRNIYITGRNGTGWWWGRGDQSTDFATVKYNSNGNPEWAKVFDNGWDEGADMAVDENGNVYITGYSDWAGTSSDFTTMKYNSNGDSIWIKRFDGIANGYDAAAAIVMDRNGNIYVTGRSEGVNTGNDIVTLKYTPEGDTIWVRRYDGPSHSDDEPVALTIDTSGNIYIVGNSKGIGGDYDIITIKYSSNGDLEWIMKYDASQNLNWPNPTNDYAVAIKVSESGEVYVAGSSEMSWSTAGSSFYTLIKYTQQLTDVKQEYLQKPIDFQLHQNYPNPFNPSTKISWQLPVSSWQTLKVYDVLGNEIATLVNEDKEAGSYEVEFNAVNLTSGVYFYQLKAGEFVSTKKMILVR